MPSVGVKRLAGPRLRDVRTVRVWVAGIATLIALGLPWLAGRPPDERPPIQVYNFAEQATEPVREATASDDTIANQLIALRPALQPKERNVPTARGRNRKANLTNALPASGL